MAKARQKTLISGENWGQHTELYNRNNQDMAASKQKKTRKFSKIETSNKKGGPGLKTKSHHSEGKFIIYCHLFDPTLSHDSPFNNLFKIIAVIFEVMNQATFDFHDFLLQGGGRTFTSKGPKDAVWSHDEWPIWKSDAVLVDVL